MPVTQAFALLRANSGETLGNDHSSGCLRFHTAWAPDILELKAKAAPAEISSVDENVRSP